LRCPKRSSGSRISSTAFDRCTNGASLHLPPAALGSIARDYAARVILGFRQAKKIFLLVLRMNSNPCINEILADARMKSANADEIFDFASDEIKSTHRLSDFIQPQGGFHRQRRFHLRARVDLVEKPTSRNLSVFLCKDYKKDIFGRFAYDFELSQNILSFLI